MSVNTRVLQRTKSLEPMRLQKHSTFEFECLSGLHPSFRILSCYQQKVETKENMFRSFTYPIM